MNSSPPDLELLLRRTDRIEPPPGLVRSARTLPVRPVSLPGGSAAYLVTDYDAVRAVLEDPRFSRAASQIRFTGFEGGGGQLVDMDPPAHTALRKVLMPAFSARRIARLRPAVERVANGLLDDLVEQGPPADLMSSFAIPFPLMIICEMWGIPDADRDRIRQWTLEAVDLTSVERSRRAAREMTAYVEGLIALRRREPGPDIVTELLAARETGALTDIQLTTMLASIACLGYETTIATLGRSVVRLLREPDLYRALATNPDTAAHVVEELLRLAPPTQLVLPRVATSDVELSGVPIPGGCPVLPCTSVANRDPHRFPAGDRLTGTRADTHHLSFGHGPHYCLGASLARLELTVALTEFAQRLPWLRPAVGEEELRWTDGSLTEGLHALPVTW
ncbi:cytochrome P450 [Nocardia sp. BMG51109]|uniref:cytochrome P450 n=1 Tax=Nocardia sp. BMG51109 TaxID=1056816 RepID=UPI0004664379|nr:cytochrome P450 [Nocardia sp. BMG51109]